MAKIITRGIDISSHQGTPDFRKVKAAGYSFVIVKAGQGLREMATFKERFLSAILAAGLDWGAYWWSDAETVAEARAEAQAFVKALDGLKPTYPVWMDQEYESPCGKWGVGKGKQLRTDMVKAFLDVLQTAGFYAGLYASTDWLNNWVDGTQLVAYDKWAAQYATACTYKGSYGMWQHHGDVPGFVGHCDGVAVPVDLNDCYKDYPEIIRSAGLNGFTGSGQEGPEAPAEKEPKTFTLHLAELRKQGYGKLVVEI